IMGFDNIARSFNMDKMTKNQFQDSIVEASKNNNVKVYYTKDGLKAMTKNDAEKLKQLQSVVVEVAPKFLRMIAKEAEIYDEKINNKKIKNYIIKIEYPKTGQIGRLFDKIFNRDNKDLRTNFINRFESYKQIIRNEEITKLNNDYARDVYTKVDGYFKDL